MKLFNYFLLGMERAEMFLSVTLRAGFIRSVDIINLPNIDLSQCNIFHNNGLWAEVVDQGESIYCPPRG
jgi:hypothetical protein